jgi:hypothetical protein
VFVEDTIMNNETKKKKKGKKNRKEKQKNRKWYLDIYLYLALVIMKEVLEFFFVGS